MKIGIAQINPTVGDIQGNVRKIIDFGRRAKAGGADLVVFPELAICGYPPMDLLLKDSFLRANLEGLDCIARDLADISVMVGFVDRNTGPGRPLHNACALLQNGKRVVTQYKTLLPTYDVFDEDRYFEPARDYQGMPVGDTVFGVSICEDIWNDEELYPTPRYNVNPITHLRERGMNALINISASPYSLSKENIRHELVRNQATRNKIPVIYVNQVGGNDELIFDGRSIALSAEGKLIGAAAAFAEDLVFVDLATGKGDVRITPADATENMYQALVLGTRDYIQKCKFKKAVVGLSGGLDSAVVCALAVEAIGAENVVGVSMPSPYSSQGSLDDAKELADTLGVEYHVIPIDPSMQAFESMLGGVFAGTAHDITEENVQARSRGMILMSMSNKFGYLVLTTGNKSELAVGYCTLYGDMCGGLALISDVPKTMVYDLARYMNELHGKAVIPQSTIDKPPSAELRPGQTDQDTLPPYVVLDGILHAYVEQRRSADEIVRLGYKPEVVMDVINRIDRNEYKRYQAAPGLKVTARSFGFGWRMPIAQGFKERLNQDDLLC
jgi:NAD+ synthase (glutamine-hydrolysing)